MFAQVRDRVQVPQGFKPWQACSAKTRLVFSTSLHLCCLASFCSPFGNRQCHAGGGNSSAFVSQARQNGTSMPRSITDWMCFLQITDKLVEKVGVQRTPTANPEMYKSDDYSAHLKGDNRTMAQRERNEAGEHILGCLSDASLLNLRS